MTVGTRLNSHQLTNVHALLMSCPYCGAQPGERCRAQRATPTATEKRCTRAGKRNSIGGSTRRPLGSPKLRHPLCVTSSLIRRPRKNAAQSWQYCYRTALIAEITLVRSCGVGMKPAAGAPKPPCYRT
jgi:hypothetical protein